MRSRWLAAALAAALTGLGAQAALADTKAGVDAWQRGDYKTAVEQWRQAAAAGDADAQFNLGQAYKLGRGVPVDPQQAESNYAKAAAQGHVQASDNYGLALFQNGRPRDAIPYLEKAVARGEPRSQYILGTMLFNGADIRKDWVRAYALMTRSAGAGLPQATQTLKEMDGYLPADQRQQGLALAQQLASATPPATPATEMAGSGRGGAMRTVDLPPSRSGPSALEARAPIYAPPPVAARPTPRAAAAGRWRLQLGAFGDAGNARKLGGQVAGRFAGRTVDYPRTGSLTKVMVGPFASRAEAAAACGSLKPCVPVGP